MSPPEHYPWYSVVDSSDELEQGDIIESCPVLVPPEDIQLAPSNRVVVPVVERSVVVMSQSCDLVKSREKLRQVLLCPVWSKSELDPDNQKSSALKNIQQGRIHYLHLIDECQLPEYERELSVVDFRDIHSLPISLVRRLAFDKPHLRILPPYREHLSQAFARYFMRVGLPQDIQIEK